MFGGLNIILLITKKIYYKILGQKQIIIKLMVVSIKRKDLNVNLHDNKGLSANIII